MLKRHVGASLVVIALTAGTALAQTTAPTQPAGPGQVMTQMPPDLMRASQVMGIDVYGADNQKIGDIDEVLIDRQGKIHGLVVGVGGFLGIGQKDVAIPFDEVQWMSNQEVQASTQAATGTNAAGGVAAPPSPGTSTASTGNQPATTGSAGAPGTGTMGTAGTAGATAGSGSDANLPARAMVKMTKADLQNAPEFRYRGDAGRGNAGTAGGTNPPPASANRPGNAPPQ